MTVHPFDPDPMAARSKFFTASELGGKPVPSRHWLAPGLVPGRTVTLLAGDGGTGKSLLALQLVVAVALGRDWLGQHVAGGRAMVLSAEDDVAELHRRLADICEAEGAELVNLDNLTIRSLAGENALLARLDPGAGALAPTPLFHELDRRIALEQPALVVLDTLADLFPGNENDRAQARQFVGMLRGLAIRHDSAVVVLAHPSLNGLNSGSGTSGSTGWSNSVRSRLYLDRIRDDGYEPDPAARVLRVMKSNYGPTGGEIALRWEAGAFRASAAAQTGLDRMAAGTKAERVFLKLLRLFSSEGRDVGHSTGHSFAPAKFVQHPDAEGVTKRAFSAAMDTLFREGKLRVEETGPPSRRTRRIVEVSDDA